MRDPQAYATMPEFAAALSARAGGAKLEVIRQPLYDRIVYPTAGIAQLQFFNNPKGTGFSSESGTVGAVTKTDADTNMTQQGQLPNPQAYWMDGIQVFVDPGSTATNVNTYTTQPPVQALAVAAVAVGNAGILDKNLILNSGWVQLFIAQKPYFQDGPLYVFPPQQRIRADLALGNSDTTTHNEIAAMLMYADGAPRELQPGVGLDTGYNFGVNINWPVLQVTPSGFNARIKTVLTGWQFRGAQ